MSMKQTKIATLIFLLLLTVDHGLCRDGEAVSREVRYNGSFAGPTLESGVTLPFGGADLDGLGWHLGASFRLATILQILDVSTAYRFHQNTVQNAAYSDQSLTLELRLHPMLFMHLFQTRSAYTLASLHTIIFAGPMMISAPEDERDFTPIFGFGLGIDVPLTALNRAEAWWLGFSWRMSFSETHELDLDTHSLNLGLSYRFHGI